RAQLGVGRPLFGAAVAALDEGLRRIGAAVVLEIELADDDGSRAGLGLERLEELPRRGDARARQPLEITGAAQVLEHLARRPAAAVAVPEDEQAGVGVLQG